jgi:hypothetical protein
MHLFAFTVFAALPFGVLLTLTSIVALALKHAGVAKIVTWLLSFALFGTTIAVPGFGSTLASGGLAGSSYTTTAQCKNVKFSAGKIKTDDVTNLGSPAVGGGIVYNEFLKVMVDADTVTFDFVLNGADPTQQALLTNLQNSAANSIFYWKITDTYGDTFVFLGYIASFDIDISFDKAITGKGSIKISGPVTVVWS